MAKRVSELIGEQVARARHRRGWSARELAEAIQEHEPGSKLNRAAIAKIESGVRGASIDEVMVLAAGLNVPPVLLLVPLGSEDEVEITSRSRIHPHLAVDWLCGDEALVSTERNVIDRGGWLAGVEPLRLYRQLRGIQDDLRRAEAAVQRCQEIGDEERLLSARRSHADALEAYHGHLRAIQAAGLQPPRQTPKQLEQMEAIGLNVEGFQTWTPDEEV